MLSSHGGRGKFFYLMLQGNEVSILKGLDKVRGREGEGGGRYRQSWVGGWVNPSSRHLRCGLDATPAYHGCLKGYQDVPAASCTGFLSSRRKTSKRHGTTRLRGAESGLEGLEQDVIIKREVDRPVCESVSADHGLISLSLIF